jgi:hypothetical protein
MRSLAAASLCALSLFLAGCFSDKTMLKVNADGSGTVVITTQMKSAALQQMREMAKAFGGENAKEPEMFTEKEAKDKAAKMGEGVEFVSFEPIKTKDAEGMKASYSFKDIRKLKINEMSEPPGAGGPGGGLKAQAKKSTPVTFKLDKLPSGNSLLTIVNPPCDLKPDQNPPPGLPNGGELPDEQLAMMKEMMGGLLVSIHLEVPGLVKTNSKHVDGSKVTILELDFDKVMGDTAKFKKLVATQPKSPEEAKALMKDFPGVKMNLEPETTIEFSGK